MVFSINKNQRGFAPFLIVVLVLAIIGVGGAAYYYLTKAKDDAGTTVVNKEAEAECKKAIDDKDLCKFASRYTLGGNYTARIAGTSSEGSSLLTIRNDGENYYSTTSIDGQAIAEVIVFNGDTYMRNSDTERWIKYPKVESDASVTDPDEEYTPELDFDEAEMPNYVSKGKEVCGSFTCFRYDFNDPEVPNSAYSMWFDDDEYKLRKIASTGEEGAFEITYDYGDVTVTAPTDYDELPSTDSGSDAMTEEQIQQLLEQYAQ